MIHSLHGYKYLVLLISILSLLTSTLGYSVEPKCGGKLKSKFGVLVTPNFPGKFSVPISCKWIIENTPDPIGDRKKRNPGLFVNGNFDSVTMEGENLMNETKLNRSHRRPNSTKRGTSRKQVKIKTMSTSPTQSTSPMGLLNTTTMRHVSRVTPTNTSEAPSGDADVIIVYFTQLFVTSGLVIKEYAYYEDESMKYAERVIFSANDKNVMTELHVTTERPYLVIEFGLDRLETNHVRALDNLLGVYGFNMTYDVVKSRDVPTVTSCSVATCSYNGHCYASANFRTFSCSCFEGFSGEHCEHGPLCQSESCSGGATCRQLGSLHTSCECPAGTSGPSCLDCHNGTISSCMLKCPGSSPGLGQHNKLHSKCSCQPNQQLTLPENSDTAIFEGIISVNISSSSQRSLYFSPNASTVIQKALGKYLGASDLDKLANVRVLNITNFGDVRFQFVCSKQDGSKARDVFNKLVERGKLQHFVLVTTKMSFKQHSSLVLKSLSANQNTPYKPGDKLVLTCITQGSALANISWYKNGDLVDPTQAVRNITITTRQAGTSTTNVDSLERVSSLHIDSVVRGDAGVYSCHLGDWTSQQCRPVGVSVSESAPDVYLDPLSLTVEVGSRVQLKCVALNELRAAQKFGYSWTKNKKLFRNDPAHEIWEELSPGGSLLTVLNIQDTSTYTCHVHGAFASVAKSLTIYVRRPSLHPLTCLPDSTPGNVGSQIPWPETLSDVTAIQDVYYGTLGNSALNRQVKQRPGCLVTRRCSLVGTRAEWRLPDFSKCATPAMLKIRNNLEKLSLGFVSTNFTYLLTQLRLENAALSSPGSREITVDILGDALSYVNASRRFYNLSQHETISSQHATRSSQKTISSLSQQLVSWSDMVYDMVDLMLRTENSLMNPEKLQQLLNLVQSWNHFRLHHQPNHNPSFLSVRDAFISQNIQLNASTLSEHRVRSMPEVPHLAFYNVTQLYNHPVVVLTPQAYSQSDLNSPRIVLIFDRNLTQFGHQGNEETLNIVIGQYNHRYKKYWPGKFNSKARYDHEDYFHYKGNIVDVSISTSRKLSIQPARSSIEIDFPMVSNLYSNLTCATKSAFDSHWDLGRCKTMVFANFTKCVCTPQGGMFAVVGRGPDDGGLFFLSHQDILSALPLSYTISLLLYGVTAAILFSRWLTRHTSIVFLKLQCTTAHIGATLVFLYAAQYNIDQGSYGLTLNILEFLMLIALTCHVSTLLVIFTALTLSPRIPHIKLSIITIVTVIPVLAVLCNTLSSPSPHLSSWWLLFPSPLAYIYLAYALSVILLYAFLYVSLLLKLHRLQDKTRISKRGIKKRKGLLHRSCVVLTSTVVMEGCSIVYVNHRSSWSQWTLASSCIVSGLSIFCCYVVYTESTRTSLLGKHKASDEKSGVSTEQEFSSDSDPLHLFIKEDKDVENTSSPYPITSKGGEIIPLSSLPLPPNIPDILEEQSTKPGSHPLNQATSTNSGSQGNSTTESVLFNNGVNGNESLNAGSPRLNQSSQQSHMQCSPKSSLTPMKFVKFQDEILENRGTTSIVGTLSNSGPRGNTPNVGTLSTSGPRGGGAYPIGVSHSSCRTESGGEAVTYNNIILTVDPYSEGMGGGGDIVTTTRVCVELGIQGDSCKDPTNMTPVFVCSVDVEPPDVNLIRDHPVYENKYQFIPGGTKYAESSLQGGTKYTDSARQNELFIQDNSKQVFDRGTQPDDPVGKSSDDPVLNRITSDLDYILNQSSNEFGSLKRGFGGQKGILKKKSSYGKSFEDLRMDTRTSL